MKFLKSFMYVIISVAIFVIGAAVSVSAQTYGELTYTVIDGTVTITDCNESATEVEIPAEIDGCPVTAIGDSAFSLCCDIIRVFIPDSVKFIGANAFYHCCSILEITIPEGVNEIKNSTFSNCSSLKSIIIPDSVISIGSDVFWNCERLETATLGKGVKTIGVAFERCYSLTSISIPEGVTRIEQYTFEFCNSLISVTIPNSVSFIGYNAFNGCKKLSLVHYIGTQEDWDSIKREYNYELSAAERHYCSEIEQQVNCGQDGYSLGAYCSICNKWITGHEKVATATGKHDYTAVVTEPTCTEKGYTTYTCVICGDTYFGDETELAGHSESDWRIIKLAAIGVAGLEQKKCTVCNTVLDEREIPALVLIGDCNNDGNITAADARLTLRVAAMLETLTEKFIRSADMNGDNKITAADARIILRKAAKLE